MTKIRKTSFFGMAAAALVAGAALASPAAAAFYSYPTLHNGNATADVTTGNVSWSGSYVQIASPVHAGATNGGTYHTVLTSGYGGVTFDAYPIPGDTTNYCTFTYNQSNSTGAIVAQGAIKHGTGVTCTKGGTYSIDFTASAP